MATCQWYCAKWTENSVIFNTVHKTGLTHMSFLGNVSLMLRIRLQRVGRKHEPSFRVVLTESQNSTKSGRIKEILGSYDPRFNNPKVLADRVKYWIGVGAKPTDTMHNILVGLKVIAGKKINVLPKNKNKPKVEEKVAEKAPESAKPKEEVAEVKEEEVKEEVVADKEVEEKAPEEVVA